MKRRVSLGALSQKVLDGFLLIVVMAWTLLPILWTFTTSISEEKELTSVPPHWIPLHPTFQRYLDIFARKLQTTEAFKAGLLNSLIVCISVAALCVFLGSLAAYAIARLHVFSGRVVLFGLLFIQMIPPIVFITSLYVIASRLNLLDRRITLVAIYSAINIPMAIWILKGYFETIPMELEDAALIDGCNPVQALFRIVLPLSGPALFTTGIFTFIAAWGEFLIALVFTNSLASQTMPVTIAELLGRFSVDYGLMTTAGIVASIPPIIIALIFQRLIIEGLIAGAVKG
ncbi:MAG: carbohydrate ABC transporter permease [Spirochaetia bacterium]|jgi:multiple sugar transport system permease protein